jgi:mRNA interferase RelE/StbE
MARVTLTSDAREDVRDLDGSSQQRVLRAMKSLQDTPQQRGQALGSHASGGLAMFRKLVVGEREDRVIYRIEPDGDVVVILVVGARTDHECYELAVSRLRLYNQDASLARELEAMLASVWEAQR